MAGKSDQAARKKATRAGRRRGRFIYIDAESLAAAGLAVGPDEPLYYRVWSGERGRFVVTLYRER